jgi:hypothetical protein
MIQCASCRNGLVVDLVQGQRLWVAYSGGNVVSICVVGGVALTNVSHRG